VLRVGKEQKQKLAGKRKGRAVQACPKYEGRFAVVKTGSGEPAKGVKYRIRRKNGQTIEGTTDDQGLTQAIKTPRPERLELELVMTVIDLDAKGSEKGRETKHIPVAEGVTGLAPAVDAMAITEVGDRIKLVAHQAKEEKFKLLRFANVLSKLRYQSDPPPIGAPSGGAVAFDAKTKKAEISLSLTRAELLAVKEVEASIAPLGIAKVAPEEGGGPAEDRLALPVDAAKHCKDDGPTVLAFHVEVLEPPKLLFVTFYEKAAETWKKAEEAFQGDKAALKLLGLVARRDENAPNKPLRPLRDGMLRAPVELQVGLARAHVKRVNEIIADWLFVFERLEDTKRWAQRELESARQRALLPWNIDRWAKSFEHPYMVMKWDPKKRLILFGEDITYWLRSDVFDMPGFYHVYVHGGFHVKVYDYVEKGARAPLTHSLDFDAEELLKIMKENGYQGGPIWLHSCEEGKDNAVKLANLTGNIVMATNERAWSDGTAHKVGESKSRWIAVLPQVAKPEQPPVAKPEQPPSESCPP
jgi:hypothetical protein